MSVFFIFISSILVLISPILYAKSILKGKTKPHRTTYFVLFVITSLATLSLLAQHDTVAIWLAGVSSLQTAFIFSLSIKYGMGGFSKMDILCLLIAVSGIILWQTTNSPIFALYASIFADFVGMVPAVIKTYKFPETEIWSFYAIDTVASFFSLLAIKLWTVQSFSYPLYLLLINFIMVLVVILPRKYRK